MKTANTTIARPADDEYAPYYGKYIVQVEGDDVLPHLVSQIERTWQMLSTLDEARAAHRYAPGKWSVKQVVGHMSDVERVFTYRALRMSRADETPLPGFDENAYVDNATFDDRAIEDLALEFRAVRSATIALFASLPEPVLTRRGTASGNPFSVRSFAWICAGHELHHRKLLVERYGLS